MGQGFVVYGVAEQLAFEVNANNARLLSLADIVVEPGSRPTVGELAPTRSLAAILLIELARQESGVRPALGAFGSSPAWPLAKRRALDSYRAGLSKKAEIGDELSKSDDPS